MSCMMMMMMMMMMLNFVGNGSSSWENSEGIDDDD